MKVSVYTSDAMEEFDDVDRIAFANQETYGTGAVAFQIRDGAQEKVIVVNVNGIAAVVCET